MKKYIVPQPFYDEIDNFINHFINERDLIKPDKYFFVSNYDEYNKEWVLSVCLKDINSEIIDVGEYCAEERGLNDNPDLSDYDYTYSFKHTCVHRLLSIFESMYQKNDIWCNTYTFRIKDKKYYIVVGDINFISQEEYLIITT